MHNASHHPDVEFLRGDVDYAVESTAPAATGKQVDYINSLLVKKDTRGTKYEGHLVAPVLTKSQAREAISALIDLPWLTTRIEQPELPAFHPEQITADPFTPGYFTVVHEDGSHTTYRLTRQKDDADFLPGQMLVGRLVGKDNESDYVTVGNITKQDHFAKVWRKHQDPTNAILRDLDTIQTRRGETGKNYAVRSRNCWRCGRLLTDTDNHAFALGLGPKCARKLGL